MSRWKVVLSTIVLSTLGLVASCRNGEKPLPAVPGMPGSDAGPEQDMDAGAKPIGPIAGDRSARDAAGDVVP